MHEFLRIELSIPLGKFNIKRKEMLDALYTNLGAIYEKKTENKQESQTR